MGDDVVAAVAYRTRRRGPEFLLVRTKDRKRWTFPKGHVKHSERTRPYKAAAREAREEAGVTGAIGTVPFVDYRYPKSSKKVDHVAAYLLRVKKQTPPMEAFRTPTWLTPAQARKRLTIGRDLEFASEHRRVLRKALQRVKPKKAATPSR